MSMSASGADGTEDSATFDRLLGELRPKLHRYCARMTGSVIDGEDVVQEALVKAIKAYPQAGPVADLEGWLFRITHNAALDFLRRRTRQEATRSDEDPDMIAETTSTAEDRQIATASLRTFMRLPVAQRSSVILMDVLGYSLREIGGVMDISIPAVKAALIVVARASASWQRSPKTYPFPSWPSPSALFWPPTSTASTRATSTPSVICLPTRYGSSSSTEVG